MPAAEIAVEVPILIAPAEVAEDAKSRTGAKPPREGECTRCKMPRPLNSKKLCYKCWVELHLEKTGWSHGYPHPAWCLCEGLGEHKSPDGGRK